MAFDLLTTVETGGCSSKIPPRQLEELLAGERVLVAPELLPRLGLEVGDRLRLGHAELEIAGTVLAEPDRVEFSRSPASLGQAHQCWFLKWIDQTHNASLLKLRLYV